MESLTQTIQIALAPVFLLVAVGSLLNVIAARLARVVDRSRVLMSLYEDNKGDIKPRVRRELGQLDKRMDVINWSIALCVACGIVVCIMVAMLFLMGAAGQGVFITPIAACFILAMLLLLCALIFFMVEVRLAISNIHVPDEFLGK